MESAPHLLLPLFDHLCHVHYKSPIAVFCKHHLTSGTIIFHSVNPILFILLLVHIILNINLITVPIFALAIYHSLYLSLQT